MTREEEIKQEAVKVFPLPPLYNEKQRRTNEYAQSWARARDQQWGFQMGAEWADEHPRNDVIGVDSITYVRNILVNKFCNIVKKNPGKICGEVPEMKEAFEMADMFDKACEFAGYKFNEEKGIYEIL